MKKFLKIYIKNVFKDKQYFLILFVFFMCALILISSGLSIFLVLKNQGNDVIDNQTNYQYYYSYTARNESSNKNQFVNPFSVFDDDKVKYEYNNVTYDIPNINFSNKKEFKYDNALAKSTFEKNEFNILDFYIGTIDKDYIKILLKTNIIDNYNQYMMKLYQAAVNKEKFLTRVENEVFNSNRISGKIIKTYTDPEDPVINIDFNDIEENMLSNLATIVDLEIIVKNLDGTKVDSSTLQVLVVGETIYYLKQKDDITQKDLYKEVSLSPENILNLNVVNLYGSEWFVDNTYRNLDLYAANLNLMSKKANFKAAYLNSFIYSNNSQNVKFRFFDRSESESTLIQNALQLNYTEVSEHLRDGPISVVISNNYAKQNNLKVGGAFNFNNGIVDQSFQIDGLGYDLANTYPLIYDTDYIPNTKNEAIIYSSSSLFSNKSKIPEDYVSEDSKIMFEYQGNDIDQDIKLLKSFLISNPISNEKIKLIANDSLATKLRSEAIYYFAFFFLAIFLFIFIVFMVLVLSTISVFISRDINKKTVQIGILKANGLNMFEITIEYILKSVIPIFFAGIIGYGFIFLIQWFILGQVNQFFNLIFSLNNFVSWYILIFFLFVIFTGFYTWGIAHLKANNSALDLMNRKFNTSTGRILNKLIDKINIKSFHKRSTLKHFAVSWKKIIALSVALCITSFMTSLLILAPFSINKVKDNYYQDQNYNLENDYFESTINNPMSWYLTYNDPLDTETLLPSYFAKYNSDTGTYEDPTSIDDFVPGDKNYLENAFGLSFLALHGKQISIGKLTEIENKLSAKGTDIEALMNEIFQTLLPTMMNVDLNLATTSSWQEAFSRLIVSTMPPEILEYWNNGETRDSFSVDFQNSKYDATTDVLGTYVKAKYQNNNIYLKGLSKTSLLDLDFDKINQSNNAVASSKFLFDTDKKVGDNVAITKLIKTITYRSKGGVTPIDVNDWLYDDGNNLEQLANLDLRHLTYQGGTDNIGFGRSYYVDAEGEIEPFINMQDIILKLKKDNIDPSYLDAENNDLFNNSIVTNDENYYYIRPFSWKYSYDNMNYWNVIMSYIKSNLDEPPTWYDVAMSKKAGDSKQPFLSIQNVEQQTTYKIVDEVNVYDDATLYTTRDNLNAALNVPSNFYNFKISNADDFGDIYKRIGLTSKDGSTSIAGLKNVESQSVSANMIGKKVEILNTIFNFALLISVTFVVIVLFISIVTIALVSDMFIQQFYSTIYLYKMLGWNNREINKMILSVFAPFNIICIIFSAFLPSIFINVGINILGKCGILIPLEFGWEMPLLISLVFCSLFFGVYLILYNRFMRLNIQLQLDAT
jgi:hypothetical protein